MRVIMRHAHFAFIHSHQLQLYKNAAWLLRVGFLNVTVFECPPVETCSESNSRFLSSWTGQHSNSCQSQAKQADSAISASEASDSRKKKLLTKNALEFCTQKFLLFLKSSLYMFQVRCIPHHSSLWPVKWWDMLHSTGCPPLGRYIPGSESDWTQVPRWTLSLALSPPFKGGNL